jgi:hypothetical protein
VLAAATSIVKRGTKGLNPLDKLERDKTEKFTEKMQEDE